MLPNRRMPPPPGAPPGMTPGEQPRMMPEGAPTAPPPTSPEGEINPAQARSAVLTVLARVKAIADRFGLDLRELMSIVENESSPMGEARGEMPPPEDESEVPM